MTGHDDARETAEADPAGREDSSPFAHALHADRAGKGSPSGVSRAKGGNGNGKHKTADADGAAATGCGSHPRCSIGDQW